MNTNISKTLKRMVRRVWNDTPSPYDKSEILTVLVGAFGESQAFPEPLKTDIENLSKVLPLLNEQQSLQCAIDQSTSKHFYWNPGLDRPRHGPEEGHQITTVTLSPSFNVQTDISDLLKELSSVRAKIGESPVNYAAIISWVLERAKEEGIEIEEEKEG